MAQKTTPASNPQPNLSIAQHQLEKIVNSYILFSACLLSSFSAAAVDQTTCSAAQDNYLDIHVRETRRCCNASFTRTEAMETVKDAIEEANNYSSAEDIKEEITTVSQRVNKLQDSKGNNGMLAHFILYKCLYTARLRELRNR